MLKKVLKITAVCLVVAFGLIQFSRPDFVNPVFDPANSMSNVYDVPADIEITFKRSCADCHTNTSNYPWYSNVAPISWGMYDHIRMGRADLNFDEWGSYDAKRQRRKLKQICDEIESGEMPHYQYLWLHQNAELSAVQKQRICKWTKETRDTISESK